MADGSIRIDLGVKTGNAKKELAAFVDSASAELNKIARKASRADTTSQITASYDKLNDHLEKTRQKMAQILIKQSETNDESKKAKLKEQYKKLNAELKDGEGLLQIIKRRQEEIRQEEKQGGFLKKIKDLKNSLTKVGLAMLGARSAFAIITKSVNAFLTNNEDVANKIKGVWSTLGEMLGPVIESIVNLILKGIAIVNAFVKALTGIDFAARANAKALKKQAQAQKEVRQSASFDEQNKLSDSSSSSSSSSGTFELPTLSENLLASIEKVAAAVKEIINFVIDNKELVLAVLAVIVAAIIAINAPVLILIGLIGYLVSCFTDNKELVVGVCLAIAGAILLINSPILALIAIVTGLWLIFKKSGDKITEYIHNKDWKGLGTFLIDGLKNGIGNIWEKIKEQFAKFWQGIKDFFGIQSPSKKFEELGSLMIDGLKKGIGNLWNKLKELFQAFWDGIVAFFQVDSNGSSKFLEFGEKLVNGLSSGIGNLWEKLKEIFKLLWDNICAYYGIDSNSSDAFLQLGKKMIEGLGKGLSGLWDKVKGYFSDLWTNIKTKASEGMENVKTAIKNKLNGIIETVESTINKVINGINSMITKLNNALSFTIPSWVPLIGGNRWSVNISKMGTVSLPRLAKGGIVVRPTQAVIGESGREAVMPLENNTEWMDELADRISNKGNTTIIVQMDGKTIARYVRQANSKYAFETNGG